MDREPEECKWCGETVVFCLIREQPHPLYLDSHIIREECPNCQWERQTGIQDFVKEYSNRNHPLYERE